MRGWLRSWNSAQKRLDDIQKRHQPGTISNTIKPIIHKDSKDSTPTRQPQTVAFGTATKPAVPLAPSEWKKVTQSQRQTRLIFNETKYKQPTTQRSTYVRCADGRSPMMRTRVQPLTTKRSSAVMERMPSHDAAAKRERLGQETSSSSIKRHSIRIDDDYDTLPGSPAWDNVSFQNFDCQPDLQFCKEKRITFQVTPSLLFTLCLLINSSFGPCQARIETLLRKRSSGFTELENKVHEKRLNLSYFQRRESALENYVKHHGQAEVA